MTLTNYSLLPLTDWRTHCHLELTWNWCMASLRRLLSRRNNVPGKDQARLRVRVRVRVRVRLGLRLTLTLISSVPSRWREPVSCGSSEDAMPSASKALEWRLPSRSSSALPTISSR
eukprot:scaffold38358_cov70-Phaeocystis_antarctica.AAC.2